MLPAQLNFQLPSAYVPFADLLSANAQMYLQCANCGWEERANVLYGIPPEGLLAEPCSHCESTKHHLVHHYETLQGRCVDCGHDLAGMKTVPWENLFCPTCHSHRLDIESVEVAPPYPSKFGEVGDRTQFGWDGDNFMRKEQPWGIDAGSDARHLQLETRKAVHFHPAESSGYLMCQFLFAHSLLESNQYLESDKNVALLMTLLASLMRDCFRQLGNLVAGLMALHFDEAAVQIETDPANKAAWEHNVAIVLNSLLVRYPEDVVAEATQRPNIREEAIAHAVNALRFYLDEAAKDAERKSGQVEVEEQRPEGFTSSDQVARTFHLIGDLRRIGNATNEERREALKAYDEALNRNLPENLLPGLRQSRGETILLLPDASAQELVSARDDLEAALNADGARLGRSRPWAVLWNQARIDERLNEPVAALATLEKAARIAMAAVSLDAQEYALEARSEPMAPLFDALALRYVADGKASEALSATEALRAATVRLHTKTTDERAQDMFRMAKLAGADLARAHLRQAGAQINQVESLLSEEGAVIDSIEPALARLLTGRGDVPTAVVGFGNPVWQDGSHAVVAYACGATGTGKTQIHCRLLHPDFDAMQWSPALVRPGPFREARLRRMHDAVADGLMKPLLPVLDGMNVQRIVFSLPGILSRYAFEAAVVGDDAKDSLIHRWEVAYVPAIAMALDNTTSAQTASGSLLVVGYQGDDLTNAAREVERLRELFGSRMTLLTGKDCTKVNVLDQLAKPFDYVHFVCHGTFDPAMPLQAALHLVPEVEDDSQRITAADILSAPKLPGHPLVTMSACSTALMSSSAVNNCHGLTGSFLRAGARGVVGSRWPVYDATASLFMSSLYGKLSSGASAAPLACLTAVQRELARDYGAEDFASFGFMGIP